MREPEKIGFLISKLEGTNRRTTGKSIEIIKNNWENIAGTHGAYGSRPTKVSRGTLFIVTRDPSWSTDTSMKSSELLRRIKEITGISEIKKLRIRADKKAFKEEETKRSEIEEVVFNVEGEELELTRKEALPEDNEVRNAILRYVRAAKEDKGD